MNFDLFILYLLSHVENERTPNSIFYMLRGKKSSQAIQDAYLFKLSPYFGIYPSLHKATYENVIRELENKKLIVIDSSQFNLTKSGRELLNQKHWFSSLFWNGQEYHQMDQSFHQKLLLLCQTASHLSYRQSNFIPIIEGFIIQQEVRKHIQQIRNSEEDFKPILKEVYQLFSQLTTEEAELYSLTLTGVGQVGLSSEQLAERFDQSVHVIRLKVKSIIHQFLQELINHPNSYPWLSQLVDDNENDKLMKSTKVTLNYIKKGMNIEQIVHSRGLKRSTIEDHVIEIATKDRTFSIRDYVSLELEEMINQAIDQVKSKRLKKIKSQLPESVSYFQIRLVLAKPNNIIEDKEIEDLNV
ncbi:helix-turn-helix domain-containing protein [Alkalibacillus aidingensis]|uniref:helix-turn-helix domain-containing protein n=1 Tax=Alkalibacillus aidingensis TaxID=2747607 RepID=UPI001660CAB8|nr:helix-turn-helix domain-containing protein [Alkalibacillus aidingensis]